MLKLALLLVLDPLFKFMPPLLTMVLLVLIGLSPPSVCYSTADSD